jgi:two-component system, chemotaxis family, sensor kinase CheA
MHLIRNSADHGVEGPDEREAAGKPRTGTIALRASQSATVVTIEVMDDGRGIDSGAVGRKAVQRGLVPADDLALMSDEQVNMLVFGAGFSTSSVITDLSGRGVGLDVVRTAIEDLRGSVALQSTPGKGSAFRIDLPVTLATARVVVARVSGICVAFPMDTVSRVRLVKREDISLIESQGTIDIEGEVLPLAPLWHLLELDPAASANAPGEARPCVVVRVAEQAFGLFVDTIEGIQEVLLTTRESLLKRVRNVAGSTILPTGEVCFVLNAVDLLASVHSRAGRGPAALPTPAEMLPEAMSRPTILIVEDSITTRTQIARVLASAGHEVVVSVDGADALRKLEDIDVDAVVSDVEMPNLDGIGLTRALREDPRYAETPIVLVTSLASDEDRKRGADAGANAYITKGGFDQEVLLDTLDRLI